MTERLAGGQLELSERIDRQLKVTGRTASRPGPTSPRRPDPQRPRDVLLTGPTGFLGARLLSDLFAATPARVWYLVRANGAAHAAGPAAPASGLLMHMTQQTPAATGRYVRI